jgi:sugar phosphate permease
MEWGFFFSGDANECGSITMWYRRHECGLRMAIFFSAATAAGAFGGLLARGIMEMRGVAGLSGWNWIFIIEGIITIIVGMFLLSALRRVKTD